MSDSDLVFTRTLRLPTFQFEPYGAESSYPVFPPDRNAADVMEWLSTNAIRRD